MAKMTVNDVINGISAVVTKLGHDGALDKEGEPVKIGLKREEGNPLIDERIMDGFGVTFQYDMLKITYQSEVMLKDVHQKGFESDIESMIGKIATFIRKEYKKETGSALSLTAQPDTFGALVQSMSRVRSWVQASKWFKIGAAGDAELRPDAEGDASEAAIRDWISQNDKKPKKPENVEIKPADNEAPEPYKKKALKEGRKQYTAQDAIAKLDKYASQVGFKLVEVPESDEPGQKTLAIWKLKNREVELTIEDWSSARLQISYPGSDDGWMPGGEENASKWLRIEPWQNVAKGG